VTVLVGRGRAVAGAALALALFATAPPARAVENEAALWSGATGRLQLLDPLSANLMLQLRFGDDVSELQSTLVRFWLTGTIRPWVEVSAGYDWLPLLKPVFVDQHRAWVEARFSRRMRGLHASNRTRIEARFIEDISPVAWRLRNGTRLTHPIGSSRFYAAASEEVFIDLRDAGPIPAGFAENRLFFGVGLKTGRHTRAEAGYQMRYVVLPARDLIQHTLMLTFQLDGSLR